MAGTTLTDALGAYAVTLEAAPPFIIRTTGGFLDKNLNGLQDLPGEPDATFSYYSFASTIDQPANLTALTTAVVQSALGLSDGGVGIDSAFTSPTPALLAGVSAVLGAADAGVRDSMGLSATGIGLMETPFIADGTGIDALLDSIGLDVTPAQVAILNGDGSPALGVLSVSGVPSPMGFPVTFAADVIIGADNVGSSGDLLYPGPGFAVVADPAATELHNYPIVWSPHIATGTSLDVHIYWTFEDFDPVTFDPVYNLRVRRSANGGSSFEPINDIMTSDDVWGGDIAADSAGNVYVASWNFLSLDVFVKKSVDGGATYGAPVAVTSGAVDSEDEPTIATDPAGGNVYVAWRDLVGGSNHDIFLSFSSDGGATFSAPLNVSLTPEVSIDPVLAVDSTGVVYLAWHEIAGGGWGGVFNVMLSRSIDGGLTFAPGANITNTPDNSGLHLEANGLLIGPGDTLYVAYFEQLIPVWNYFLMRSEDGGSTFSAPVEIVPGASILSLLQAWVGGNNFVAVWGDESNGLRPMFLTMSGDGGASFTTSAPLWSSDTEVFPQGLAVDSAGNLHLLWEESGGIIDRVNTLKLRIK